MNRSSSVVAVVALLFVANCASTPAPDRSILDAGENAQTFTGVVEFGSSLFGRTKAVGQGRLEIGSAGLLWNNEKKAKRNLALKPDVIERVWLTCASRPTENLCLDLGIETFTGNEYHFRDVNWEGGGNTNVLAAFEHLKAQCPQARFDRKAVGSFR